MGLIELPNISITALRSFELSTVCNFFFDRCEMKFSPILVTMAPTVNIRTHRYIYDSK